MSRNTCEFLVAGAGISGLAAARAVESRGHSLAVLDAGPQPGGLTRTITAGDYSFDYTGHFLHLAKYKRPSAIPFADLNDSDWTTVSRRSAWEVGGKELVPAPLQYNLGWLPPQARDAAFRDYEQRPQADGTIKSFADYVTQGFGRYVAENYLIPQNTKTMAIGLDKLSTAAVKRFFPPPDEGKVRAGFNRLPIDVPSDYNSEFYYPKQGGIELLTFGLTRGLQIFRSCRIVSVRLSGRVAVDDSGRHWRYDRFLSSIPLKQLCQICDDPELQDLGKQLTHASTLCLEIGMRRQPAASLQGLHWVYIPDTKVSVYRVGLYSNIGTGMAPAGSQAMYAEIGLVPGEVSNSQLAPLAHEALRELSAIGWIDEAAVDTLVLHLIPCSYVHFTPARDQVMPRISSLLTSFGVHPIGRYGLWDYISMEDSISGAIATANEVMESSQQDPDV